MEQNNKFSIAFIALLILPLTGLSIDIYVPSLPAVSRYFDVGKTAAQLSITLYMIGFGTMQLVTGTISDRFGRKNPAILSLIAYTVFTFLIPFSSHIIQLLLLRLLQGISVAFFSVAMRAVIADLYEGYQFYKVMNYMTILWSIGPIIAPAIGGYLQTWVGWQGPFYVLGIYSTVMLLLNLRFMPETIKKKHQFNGNVLLTFKQFLVNKEYVIGLINLGMLYSLTILFSIVAPFLIQNVLHYTPIEFGHMALLMGVAWSLGNLTNRLSLRASSVKKIRLCFSLMLIDTIIMAIIAYVDPVEIYNIIINSFILFFLGGLIFPNYFARCVALFSHLPATANSLMGASMMLITGLSSALGTLLRANSTLPLAFAYMFITVIGLCLALSIKPSTILEADDI